MKQVSIESILDFGERNNMYLQWYPGISEMGYDDKEAITGDWWQRKSGELRTPLADYIEKAFDGEVETYFYDEWMGCLECNKLLRSTHDCYSWEPSFVWTSDCSIACHECIESDETLQEDTIEFYKNSTDHAVPSWFYQYLEAHGFVCYSPDEYCKRFETGWYPGQNDNPSEVAKDIESNLPDHDFIFKIDSVGQFDCSWSVFLRRSE